MTSPTILTGGNWSAVNISGTTYYQSGTTSVTGPVVLSSIGTLTVSSGAVVSGAVLSGGVPTVSVLSGGTMTDSTEVNGYLIVANGGVVSGNTYNSNEVTISSGGSSINDTYINSGSAADGAATVSVAAGATLNGATFTSGTVGGLSAVVASGANVSDLTVGAGATAVVSSGATVSNTVVTGSGLLMASAGANLDTTTVSSGAVVSGAGANITSMTLESGGRAAVTDSTGVIHAGGYIILNGGNWSAVDVGGTTYYQSGTTSVTGPVVLSSIGTLTVSSGAVVSGAVLSGGVPTVSVLSGGSMTDSTEINGYLVVANGGIVSGNTYNSNAVTISSGGSSINDTYINSGSVADGTATVSVAAGATLNGATFTSGAVGGLSAVVASGANVSGLTVGSGVTAVVSSGANISAVTATSGSVVSMAATYGDGTPNSEPSVSGATVLNGGNWSAVNVSGTTYYQSGTTSVTGPVVLSNIGTLTVSSGAVVSGATISGGVPTVSVLNGGTMVNSSEVNGYLVVANGATVSGNVYNSNVVTISSGGSSINDTYVNSGPGADGAANVTVMSGATVTSPYLGTATAGAFTMTVSSGAIITDPTTVAGGGSLVTSAGIDGSAPCFLADSMVTLAQGEVPVQDIDVGDEIVTYHGGTVSIRKVTWVGKSQIRVQSAVPDDQAGYPVRVLKDAIAPDVPYKDMLITAEHCLFLDGAFVPVRMLVNGRSIFYDKTSMVYDCYHIETETHSVIRADGVLTESYLDTGNRYAFQSKGSVVAMVGRPNLDWNDAAAPLRISRDFVEPLFRQIEARAEQAGLASRTVPVRFTDDAALHLVTGSGHILHPVRRTDDRVMFMVSGDVRDVRIVSRTSRPYDMIGPFVDDRRQLGVLVGEVLLFEAAVTRPIETHLGQSDLPGWDRLETVPCRWTNGNAVLPLGQRAPDSIGLLAIQIIAGGPYPADELVSMDMAVTA
ncbi:Adhesin family protein [Granulibacter bethesdensis]|uniref:Adhesin family protein n=1 Tax=Granulibacter bethesdensis TaxID=364410 RepID=A0AAC9K7N0_9PROT|nr:Hint domain-containing protein [Granulibacter bethesdensis]APH54946.1 Adhesin family protein [Granulibacter bethesdensis]